MTDQIPADLVERLYDLAGKWATSAPFAIWNDVGSTLDQCADELRAVLPPPPRPKLADMTLDEQDECTGMQADLVQGDSVVILDGTPDSDSLVQVLKKSLEVYRAYPAEVTPRPDLPRMEWPGNKKPDPAPTPALPDGWRIADHKENGRVIVTNTAPSSDGRVYYALPSADPLGFDWLFCDPADLTYLDQEADTADTKGAGTPTAPDHLAVGTVIESADDPRIAAIPVGSILLDRDGDTTTRQCLEWVGPGYTPEKDDGAEFGPWTVLHIQKEADQ